MAMTEILPIALIAFKTASSSSERQSHNTLPFGVRRNKARCPMANCDSMPMPINPGSLAFREFRSVIRSFSRVVRCCPVFLTSWRSSSQMPQATGVWSHSAYCVPQVVQIDPFEVSKFPD